MKKKLVLFALLLGLLLPVFGGFTAAALRTEAEFHELDKAKVEEARKAYRPGEIEIENAQLDVERGERAIQNWIDAIEFLRGAELTEEEARKAYEEAKKAYEDAENAEIEADDALSEAQDLVDDLSYPVTDAQVNQAKADMDAAYAVYLDAVKNYDTAAGDLNKLETEHKANRQNLQALAQEIVAVRADKEANADLINNLNADSSISTYADDYKNMTEAEFIEKHPAGVIEDENGKIVEILTPARVETLLGYDALLNDGTDGLYAKFNKLQDNVYGNYDAIDPSGAGFTLEAAVAHFDALEKAISASNTLSSSDTCTFVRLVLDRRALEQNGSAATDANVTKAKKEYEELRARYEELAAANADDAVRQARLKEAQAARNAAEAALTEAQNNTVAAEKAMNAALKALEGAIAFANSEENKESARNKVAAAKAAAEKEFTEKKAGQIVTVEYLQTLLDARKDKVEELQKKWKAEFDALQEALWYAENRPADVTGLKAVANSDGTITLTWDAVKANYFNIYQLVNKKAVLIATVNGETTTYVHQDPIQNEMNFYTVIANDIIEGDNIDGYQNGFAYAKAEKTNRPANVTGLKAVSNDRGYVTISWDAAEGATYYRVISLGLDGKAHKVIAEITETSYEDEDAVGNGELYPASKIFNFYTVEAVKVVGEDEFTSVSTTPSYVYAQADTRLRMESKPEPIKNMKATTNADGSITVSWSPDAKAFYYNVYYIGERDAIRAGVANEGADFVHSTKDTSMTFTDLGEGYQFFRVYAVNKVDGQWMISDPATPNYTFAFTAGTEVEAE